MYLDTSIWSCIGFSIKTIAFKCIIFVFFYNIGSSKNIKKNTLTIGR